jgi:hypothetical protein
MAGWRQVEEAAPELAARARRILDGHVTKVLATLRRDGSPRVSGIEIEFVDGELWMGSMWGAVKALDLRRDPRFALHGPASELGDVKLAGRVEEVTDPERIEAINGPKAPPGPSHLFRADIAELVVIAVGDPADHLVIESWHESRGVTRRERR